MPNKSKPRALGDDPLAWIKSDAGQASSGKPGNLQKDQVDNNPVFAKELSGNEKTDTISAITNTKAGETPSKINEVNSKPCDFLELDQAIHISKIVELNQKLTSLSDEDYKLVYIDGSSVKEIDTASIQLLLSFSVGMKKRDRKVVLKNISPYFSHQIDLLGLSLEFNKDT